MRIESDLINFLMNILTRNFLVNTLMILAHEKGNVISLSNVSYVDPIWNLWIWGVMAPWAM